MENNTPQQTDNKEMHLSLKSRELLLAMAPWAKLFGVFGMVMCGLMAILSIFIGQIYGAQTGTGLPFAGQIFMTILYLGMAVLYFFPSLYIYKCANYLKSAVKNKENALLEDGFYNLKKFFKFVGIIIIVTIAFYVLAILFGLTAFLFAAG